MIEFLRMRQEIKRIEVERMQRAQLKRLASQRASRTVSRENKDAKLSNKPSSNENGSGKTGLGEDIIQEEEGEHHEEHSDRNQLDKDIQEFLIKSKIEMQRAGVDARDIKTDPRQTTGAGKVPQKLEIQGPRDGGPRMKGNIGPSIKTNLFAQNLSKD